MIPHHYVAEFADFKRLLSPETLVSMMGWQRPFLWCALDASGRGMSGKFKDDEGTLRTVVVALHGRMPFLSASCTSCKRAALQVNEMCPHMFGLLSLRIGGHPFPGPFPVVELAPPGGGRGARKAATG